VTQVIPSTTILVLENFEGGECEQTPPAPTGDYYYFTNNTNRLPSDFSIDSCTIFTTSSVVLDDGINNLTIIAVPEDTAVTLTYVSDGITSTVDECNTQSCLVRIDNSYVHGLPLGYKVLQYYVPSIETTSAGISLQFTDGAYYYTSNNSQLPNSFSIDNMQLSNETSIILNDGIDNLTIIVVPEQRNVTLTYVSDGITSTVDECGEQNCLRRINNSYVHNIPSGYKTLQYYVPNITTTYAEINLE
jgi:SH3-like domain-containing protein